VKWERKENFQLEQKETWENISQHFTLDTLLTIYNNPKSFQRELATFLNSLFSQEQGRLSAIEIGASFGITSALLANKFDSSILDIDKHALQRAKDLFAKVSRQVIIHEQNMFNLKPIPGKYDLIFNSGVMEHFEFQDRVKIITQMKTKLKDSGKIVLAVPNQFSFPYKLGYQYLNSLGKWIYPPEFKIYDFSKEVEFIGGLRQVNRLTINKDTIYNFLPKPVRFVLRKLDSVFDYEGYLTVVVIEKQ
jgi:2-polyprenyl-3-methyl-5-hydroxy-6-metoxy-1,4-benzoquinol methylase